MLSEAMRLNPNDSFANANLADAYRTLGRNDEARSCHSSKPLPRGWVPLPMPFRSILWRSLVAIRPECSARMDSGKGPSVEPIMLLLEGMGRCALGKVQSARQTFAQASQFGSKLPALRNSPRAFAARRFLPG